MEGERYRDRYIKTVYLRAGDVKAHPDNPKIHTELQAERQEALLDEFGKADALKAYQSERFGCLVYWDGHLRSSLDPDEIWRVDIYDFTDDEVAGLIRYFDPVASLARVNDEKMSNLYKQYQSRDDTLLVWDEQVKASRAKMLAQYHKAQQQGGGGSAPPPMTMAQTSGDAGLNQEGVSQFNGRQQLLPNGREEEEGEGLQPSSPQELAPSQFPEYGEEIATDYCCPKCGYEWSGQPK